MAKRPDMNGRAIFCVLYTRPQLHLLIENFSYHDVVFSFVVFCDLSQLALSGIFLDCSSTCFLLDKYSMQHVGLLSGGEHLATNGLVWMAEQHSV